eukprot:877063-Lingulodinium_polyedra.AAC.1
MLACETPRNDALESTRRLRNGPQTARSRTPRADQKLACAWNARTRGSRTAAPAKRRRATFRSQTLR